jgi:hypothetical protein
LALKAGHFKTLPFAAAQQAGFFFFYEQGATKLFARDAILSVSEIYNPT